mgnify:CR=1 FL=1
MTSQTPAGDAPPPAGTTPPPGGFFNQVRSIGLYRSQERWIGGVAGGIAARLRLDPLLVRGLFLATLLLGGFGLVLYALAWALLPEERDGRIHLEGLTLGHPDIALLGALAMLVAGLGGEAWGGWPRVVPGWIQGMFWLGATLVVIVLVAAMLQRRRPPAPLPGPYAPFAGPTAPYPPTSPYAGPAGRRPAPVPPPAWSTSAPYRDATAPAPPETRASRRGPGATIAGITVALCLFVIAGALLVQRAGWLDRSAAGTAAALVVVVLGVALFVAGLRGRRGGVLTFLAIVALLVATPVAVTTRDGFTPRTVDSGSGHTLTAQGTTTVTDRATAAGGYQMNFGNATLNLAQVPLRADDRLGVPIDVAAGNLTILVPRGAHVAAQADVGAGQVTWHVAGDDTITGGVSRHDAFGVPVGQAELLLQLHVTFGNVTVQEGI